MISDQLKYLKIKKKKIEKKKRSEVWIYLLQSYNKRETKHTHQKFSTCSRVQT